MNNDEQDMQPLESQAEATENAASDAVADVNENEAGAGDAVEAAATQADAAEDAAAESPAEIIAGEARDEQDAQMPGEVEEPVADEAAPQIAQASETSQAEGDVETAAADSGDNASVEAPAEEAPAEQAAPAEEATSTEEVPAVEAQAEEAVASDDASTGIEAAPADAGAGSEAASESDEEDYQEPVVRTKGLQDVSPNASMEDLLRASEQQYRTLKHGDVVEGTVMKVGRDEILVDIGAKTEGIVPSAELQSLTPEEREALAIGDPLLVSVVQPENNEGHAVLSLDRARQERSWRDLQKKFEAGEVIQARVTGYNKGGLLVNLEGVRGFVPSSQISSLTGGSEANKQSEMAKLQSQTIPMKIIEINRSRNRLILSERQAMQEQRESVRSRLLRELEPGQVRLGRVSSICDFGAFVDIGGADGLIHLSEISWKRVAHPSDVLKVGDQVNVYVLSVDPNERKIALSLKRTQPEPWSTITENYRLGQVVHGTITQLTTFGAFARLEDGIEGLIHVSELAEGRVAHPKNVVNVGDALDLKVIRIDPAKRRIGLSLKRMNEDENAPVPADYGDEGASSSAATMEEAEGGTEAPMGQVEMNETADGATMQAAAVEPTADGESAPAQPAAQTTEQPERAPRQERQDNRGRDRDRDRNRGNQPRQQGNASSSSGDEPMGALAQALGAFMSRDDSDEEETTEEES